MDLISPLAEEYSREYSSPLGNHLERIYRETYSSHSHAHMLSGPVQGRFLQFFSELLSPRYILEIGTFTGYSAICLAAGLQPEGQLHTIEMREDDAATALRNISLAGFSEKIRLHAGDAHQIIPTLNYSWDLVFMDADKTSYIEYYEMIVPRLSNRGCIIADNVLFHGQVLGDKISGKNAKAVDAFNKHVAADSRTEQVLLTIRDGLLLIKKV